MPLQVPLLCCIKFANARPRSAAHLMCYDPCTRAATLELLPATRDLLQHIVAAQSWLAMRCTAQCLRPAVPADVCSFLMCPACSHRRIWADTFHAACHRSDTGCPHPGADIQRCACSHAFEVPLWLRPMAAVHVGSLTNCQAALLSCCHLLMNRRLGLVPSPLMAANCDVRFPPHTFS